MCAGVKVDLHICKEYEHYYAIHPVNLLCVYLAHVSVCVFFSVYLCVSGFFELRLSELCNQERTHKLTSALVNIIVK